MLAEVFQLTISGIATGCVYALVALGIVLIYKATELVNFGQGEFMMLGAFLAYTATHMLGLNFFFGIAAALVAMFVLGAGLDRFVLRRILGQPHFVAVMLTLGFGYIIRSISLMVWGSYPLTLDTPFQGQTFEILHVVVGAETLFVIGTTMVLTLLLYAFFRFSTIGIAMQAMSQNQLAAYYMGIPVERFFSLIWGASAAVATMAGILLAPFTLIDLNMGAVVISAFAAAILGGLGSFPGAIVGGLVIGLSEQFAGVYLPHGFKEVTPHIILLAVLFLKPSGLFETLGARKV